MNRFISFFVIFLGINITLLSTNIIQVERTYTERFDSVFSVVSRVQATTGILYERLVPFAQLQKFNSNVYSVDTSNAKHFIQGYSELYNAAFQSFAKLPYSVDSLNIRKHLTS